MARRHGPHGGRVEAWTADRVFDGERLLPAGTSVLVDGETIVAMLSPQDVLPPDCPIVSFPDGTLLPGLVETHAHLCCDSGPGALERIPAASGDEMVAIIESSLRAQLAAGVSTVRDLGDRRYAVTDWRDAHPDDVRFPRVLGSGPPITAPGGHCANMGGEATGPDALRQAVRERAARSVDAIKVMASGGINTPGSDAVVTQFDADELRVIVDEAHRAGLPVTAHAHSTRSIRDALDADVDQIEHASFVHESGFGADPAIVADLATRRVPVCPTLGVLTGVPPPPAVVEMMRRTGMTLENRSALYAGLHRAGVLLVSGSDAGINPGKRHGVLPEALIALADAGVAPAEVLVSATSLAADALGLAGVTGRLRAGRSADLLAVGGDPVTDITAIRDVLALVVRGARAI